MTIRNHFNNYENDDDDHGNDTILEISPTFPRTRGAGVIDILMQFNEDNDCTIKELYMSIGDFAGYKRYSIKKIKDE